ncbi:MAG: hypothetical protein ACKOD0_01745, partial [Actinomycetota bacterium]
MTDLTIVHKASRPIPPRASGLRRTLVHDHVSGIRNACYVLAAVRTPAYPAIHVRGTAVRRLFPEVSVIRHDVIVLGAGCAG